MDDFSFDSIKGNGLAIVSGAFFGLQFYLNSKKQADASSSMKIQYLFSILFFLFYVIKHPVLLISKQDGFYITLLGIITAGLAGISFTKCIERIPPFSANVLCMSEIVFAPVLAFLFLHEWFDFHSLLGAVFIVLSLLYNVYKQRR
ncbi:DMT family transporter [Floccifex sp.]|uniref:DMT family transporter n=1 Tax=Floccifex sp. TaxID=2815810 RepID=UPI003EFDAC36